jgi:hypothetical protein
MRPNPLTPDHQHPGGLPAPDTAATASPAPASAGPVRRRQLEKSVSWSGGERLRLWWYRLRLSHAEINYANRRLFEIQAPWTADPQWHLKTDQPPQVRAE